jgi:hypothetical protein
MKKSFFTAIAILLLTSCSAIGPKVHVAHDRSDLDVTINKIILFPTTDFSGKVTEDAKEINLSIISGWGGVYGADKTIPAGIVIEKIANSMGNSVYSKFISGIDNVSQIEQTISDPKVKKFVNEIAEKLGNYQFAVAIISGGKTQFDAGQEVHLHLGLFDTKNMTWRLITKAEEKKGLVGNWKAESQMMIAKSFNEIKKMNIKTK